MPVPEGQVVASPADAWEAAQDIGLPVVVKPTDGNHGRGVFARPRLAGRGRGRVAWPTEGSDVIVERFIRGDEHRLLVVGGAGRGRPRRDRLGDGDGRSTVAELIDAQINTDPRRGVTEDHPLNRLNPRDDGVSCSSWSARA